LSKLEIAFNTFGKPTIFQSDHGKEFDNLLIRGYCQKFNIQYIQGSICHSESQGAVERVKDFINQPLTASFRDFKKNATKNTYWDIENAIEAFTVNQNTKVHCVTKIPPQDLVTYRDKALKAHQKICPEVFERVQRYYNGKNQRLTADIVCMDMKVFIIGEVEKRKHRNLLQKPAKGVKNQTERQEIWKIPAIITDISKLNRKWVKIRVCGFIKDGIKLGGIYDINVTNLAIPSREELWESLIEESAVNFHLISSSLIFNKV